MIVRWLSERGPDRCRRRDLLPRLPAAQHLYRETGSFKGFRLRHRVILFRVLLFGLIK